ncbi:MAG: helix-turn-helix domain-containing protein [Candidatus Omnitrophota bacterium]
MRDDFNSILGQRLKDVREELKMTLEEVAKKIGFNNYQTLSDIESGSRQVKAYELAALSKIYFKDINYFLSLETAQVASHHIILWRNATLDTKLKVSREQEFLKYCANYFELEKKFGIDHKCGLPSFDLAYSDFNYQRAAELANNCYNLMQLGTRPACCLEKVLEQKYNVKILYLNLQGAGSSACSMGDFGASILINSSEPAWRRTYDLGHELFHLLTWNIFPHDKVHESSDMSSLIEKWANYFASVLLLPAEEMKSEMEKRTVDNEISDIDLIGVAREFGVSIDALVWRMVTLNQINQKGAQDCLEHPGVRDLDKYARIDDRKEAPCISERYINLAFKAYQQGKISKGKLAEYLNVDRAQVGGKLSEYGYDEKGSYDGSLTIA